MDTGCDSLEPTECNVLTTCRRVRGRYRNGTLDRHLMTAIKDPGNQTESYSDALVRQWRETSGLWKTDYGNSQAALAAMTTDRNNWQASYNAKVTELKTNISTTGLEPVTPSLSSWCSPN